MVNDLKVAFVAAFALTLASAPAWAGSELQPGLTAGIPLGVPLPPGVYDVTIGDTGTRDARPGFADDVSAVVPTWILWSTPWTIAGARVILDTATPYIDAKVKDGPRFSGLNNTLLDAQLKWDLGGGFFGGVQAGVYLPNTSQVGRDLTSFQGVAAISYLKDGWNLSATFIYGTGGTVGGVLYADWVNLDLTATKKFGKFEVGAVGFGSTDLNGPKKMSQFALGGLVGYDFGPVNVQLKLTRDVSEENYGGYDTRGWATLIIPLYIANAPASLK